MARFTRHHATRSNRLQLCIVPCAMLLSGLSGCSSDPATSGPAADVCGYASFTPGYPAKGCGVTVGTVIDNYQYSGRLAGLASPAAKFRLGDWFNPDGKKPNKYMFLTVAAEWCIPCKEKARALPEFNKKYGPKGVVALSNLAQKVDRTLTNDADIDTWIKAYSLDTPVGQDSPEFALSAFFDPNQMPLNLIIDLKTMKIVSKTVGADSARLEAELDALLAK